MQSQILKIIQLSQGVQSRWYNWYYRLLGVKLRGYVWMQKIEIPRNYRDIEIGEFCALDRGVTLLCSGESLSTTKLIIGAYTYINRNTFLDATLSLVIGEQCAIGPGCYITDHDHGSDISLPPLQQPMIAKPTKIGNCVWIGANVTVLKGVTIGDNVVVGAGSVVTKDIPANTMVAGVPARILRVRV